MTWSCPSDIFSKPLEFDQMPRMAGDSPIVPNSKQAIFACWGDLAERTRPANSSVHKLPQRRRTYWLLVKVQWTMRGAVCFQAPSGICCHATIAHASIVGATTSMDRASSQTSAIVIASSNSGGQRFKPRARLRMALYSAPAHRTRQLQVLQIWQRFVCLNIRTQWTAKNDISSSCPQRIQENGGKGMVTCCFCSQELARTGICGLRAKGHMQDQLLQEWMKRKHVLKILKLLSRNVKHGQTSVHTYRLILGKVGQERVVYGIFFSPCSSTANQHSNERQWFWILAQLRLWW